MSKISQIKRKFYFSSCVQKLQPQSLGSVVFGPVADIASWQGVCGGESCSVDKGRKEKCDPES